MQFLNGLAGQCKRLGTMSSVDTSTVFESALSILKRAQCHPNLWMRFHPLSCRNGDSTQCRRRHRCSGWLSIRRAAQSHRAKDNRQSNY
jgi:hypothetical protein